MALPATSGMFGRYFLQERVATGGMAEVFRAIYRPAPGIEKTVALKRVLPHLARDEEFLTLFHQEAAIGARLAHANVVQLLDAGEQNGEPFLALEFVHGRNLRQILRRCGERRTVMPIALSLYIAMEAAKGLAYAHALRDAKGTPLGIVHRDVSPANVLVSFEGEVKVADFGIARAVAYASVTSIGRVRGKASYMSPQQAQGAALDARSDQFALAAILWELVTGRRLFSGDSETEIIANVLNAPIPLASQGAAGVPAPVDELLAKALSRDPDRRFPDALAFSRAIAGVLARLGPPIAGADVATWLRGLFREDLELEERAAAAMAEKPASSTHVSGAASVPVMSPYADDLEPEVQPLPIEERRRLFDMPPPREPESRAAIAQRAAPPPEEPLELVRDERLAHVERVVTRFHVSDGVPNRQPALRLAVVGSAFGLFFFAFLLFVYRH